MPQIEVNQKPRAPSQNEKVNTNKRRPRNNKKKHIKRVSEGKNKHKGHSLLNGKQRREKNDIVGLKVIKSTNGTKVTKGISSDTKESLFHIDMPEIDFSSSELAQSLEQEQPTITKNSNSALKKGFSLKVKKNKRRWWADIVSEDPLSLEPISDLEYPPFELCSNVNKGQVFYFDGLELAKYFVKRSNFINPLNRVEVKRETCVKLDLYLKENKLEQLNVVDAFDIFKKVKEKNRENYQNLDENRRRQVEELQREETTVLHSMFSFNSRSRETISRRRQRRNGVEENERQAQLGFEPLNNVASGTNGIIDNDLERFQPQAASRQDVQESFPVLKSNIATSPNFDLPNWVRNGRKVNTSSWDTTIAKNIKQSLQNSKEANEFFVEDKTSSGPKLEPIYHRFEGYFSPFSVSFYDDCQKLGFEVVFGYETRLLALFDKNGSKKFVEIEVKSEKKCSVIERLCAYYELSISTLYRKSTKFLTVSNNNQNTKPRILLSHIKNGVFASFYNSKIRDQTYAMNALRLSRNIEDKKSNILLSGIKLKSMMTMKTSSDLSEVSRENLEMFFKFGIGIRSSSLRILRLNNDMFALQFQNRKDARIVFTKIKDNRSFKILSEELRHKGVANTYFDHLEPKAIQFWPETIEFLQEQIKFIQG